MRLYTQILNEFNALIWNCQIVFHGLNFYVRNLRRQKGEEQTRREGCCQLQPLLHLNPTTFPPRLPSWTSPDIDMNLVTGRQSSTDCSQLKRQRSNLCDQRLFALPKSQDVVWQFESEFEIGCDTKIQMYDMAYNFNLIKYKYKINLQFEICEKL